MISLNSDIKYVLLHPMPTSPMISVVMPTYNDAPFLEEAIRSVLNQTFQNFEFVIVNDGSTDHTEQIINQFLDDKRIVYLTHPHNQGNTVARNTGIAASRGQYIALMDSDDVLASTRLQIQIDYLKAHPEIDVLGGAIIFFYPDRWHLKVYPSQPDYIKSKLFFLNCMGQPTVMARREIFLRFPYHQDKENMEDYFLWYSMAMAGIRISNLPNVLLYYRQSDSQLSHPTNTANRERMLIDFFRERLLVFDISLSDNDFKIIHSFIRGRVEVDAKTYQILDSFFDLVEERNKQKGIFASTYFKAVLFFQRLKLIKYAFLERGNRLQFLKLLYQLIIKTGLASILIFWKNEGKYLKNTGESKMHYSPLKFN